jgi:stage II sporulation protein GA (sporulation sigma-E factor processing peptidase)
MIYVDLIFLVNFLTDGALLMATAWTRKLRIRLWRVALAASIGSLYVLLMLAPQWSAMLTFGIKFIVSVSMIAISFGYNGWQAMLRNVAAFYMVAFAAAGGIYGLYYFFLPPKDVMESVITGVFEWSAGYGFIGMCFVFMIWLYMRVFRGAKQKETLAAHTAQVEVEVKGYRLTCTGLVDTGNQLYDPLTKTPVMIVEALLWKEVLPEVWLKRIQTSDADTIVAAMGEDEFIWQDRLRIVPYRGVNRSTQFMLALKPDRVRLEYAGKEWETSKVLIGFDGGTLSSDGSYQAIIHPMLLQE